VVTGPKRVVEWIDADSAHRDKDFAVLERGLRKVDKPVLAVVTIGLVLDRSHRLAPGFAASPRLLADNLIFPNW
jgi:hypothetical protein